MECFCFDFNKKSDKKRSWEFERFEEAFVGSES